MPPDICGLLLRSVVPIGPAYASRMEPQDTMIFARSPGYGQVMARTPEFELPTSTPNEGALNRLSLEAVQEFRPINKNEIQVAELSFKFSDFIPQFILDWFYGKETTKPSIPLAKMTIKDLESQGVGIDRLATANPKAQDFPLGRLEEKVFKRRYLDEAAIVGARYSMTKEQSQDLVAKIYAIEGGGYARHDTFAGHTRALSLQADLRETTPGKTTAIGYNQILASTSMEILLTRKTEIIERLNALALDNPKLASILEHKAKSIESLHKLLKEQTDTLKAKLFPGNKLAPWPLKELSQANTELAFAVHSLNIDSHLGPIFQAQQFERILSAAKQKNFAALTKAKAELIETAVKAYDRLNPKQKEKAANELVALIKPSTSPPTNLEEKTRQDLKLKLATLEPGNSRSLAKENLAWKYKDLVAEHILEIRSHSEEEKGLSPEARLLQLKIYSSYHGGLDGAKLLPAAIHLANLAGRGGASRLLHPRNSSEPVTKFFSAEAVSKNSILKGRSALDLLLSVHKVMHESENHFE